MPRSNLEYSGGGCALNTARVFQWLSPTPSSAVFLGGLGKVGLFPLLETIWIEIAGWQWGRPWKSRQQWRCSHCICKTGQWNTGSPSDLKKWVGEPDKSVVIRSTKTHFNETLQEDLPTGHCIALVEGAERTLAANLGAANKFSAQDLWQGNNRTLLEGSKVQSPFLSFFILDGKSSL